MGYGDTVVFACRQGIFFQGHGRLPFHYLHENRAYRQSGQIYCGTTYNPAWMRGVEEPARNDLD